MQNSVNETKLLGKVSKYKEPFKSMGLRLHRIIMETCPQLIPSSMYGMPAYRDPETKKLVCLFRHDKFFTFSLLEDASHVFLDKPADKIRPYAYFMEEINDEVEKKLVEILKEAIK